jgi:hypothetical protein
MKIGFTSHGDWSKTEEFLRTAPTKDISAALGAYGDRGVAALAAATPTDTGETANSWYYELVHRKGYWSIRWHNRHVDGNGEPIAVLLQYGHGTRNGGYVQGIDYIMPAIRPIFDEIANEAWKVVTNGGN